ncbi:GAP family protein [Bogoriella caseilytica]|uniref:GAP family protein n=1 Tax=Bogoriella caseilytica TaxID=56055 RepID=UPI0014745C63|nr:GAP family protein [Bogoriella caseilytica]
MIDTLTFLAPLGGAGALDLAGPLGGTGALNLAGPLGLTGSLSVPEGGGLAGVLAILALIDSTSFGTLLIPLWLLLSPGRLRAGRVLIYLAVVAGAYLLIGLALLTALLTVGDVALNQVQSWREQPVFLLAQGALAAGLILFSLRLDPMTEAGKARKREREAARGSSGRVSRLRERAVGEGARGGLAALLALALSAVALEIATLIPYLAGIGLVAGADPGAPASAGLLLLYCAVMIAPALLLLLGRVLAHRHLEPLLRRLEGFLSKHAHGTVALVLFLLGIFLGLNALEGLDLA